MENKSMNSKSKLIPLDVLKTQDAQIIRDLQKQNFLKTYQSKIKGTCFNIEEYQKYMEIEPMLPKDLVYLKSGTQAYADFSNLFKRKFLMQYKIGQRSFYSQKEYETYLMNYKANNAPLIFDLTLVAPKYACIYRSLTKMSTSNRDYCQKNNRLARYKNIADRRTYISLLEYLQPQIKIIANKLEIKEFEVKKHIHELLIRLFAKK